MLSAIFFGWDFEVEGRIGLRRKVREGCVWGTGLGMRVRFGEAQRGRRHGSSGGRVTFQRTGGTRGSALAPPDTASARAADRPSPPAGGRMGGGLGSTHTETPRRKKHT